nr:alpha/beta hydrolase [Acidimicrobiia bacterium]
MRALEPRSAGIVERDGVLLAFEVFGDGEPTVVLLPTWSIIHSRFWKAQVATLARRHRVVTFDGRGVGRSGRPVGAAAYTHHQFTADTLAVLDATGTEQAVLVALSCGVLWAAQLAADHPERALGIVTLGPAVALAPAHPDREVFPFDEPLTETRGWAKYNRHHWQRDFPDFLEFFFTQMFTEPHSTKQIEDCVEWASDTDPARLADANDGIGACGMEDFRAVCERVCCPVLVIHGDEDELRPHAQGVALADATRGSLVTIAGGGHGVHARDPILVNQLIRDFVERVHPTPS